MKVAITATGKTIDSKLDTRFGRCGYFVIIDSDSGEILDAVANKAADATGGAGPKAVQQVVDLGVDAVVSGNFGPKAFNALQAANLKVYMDAFGTVADTFVKFRDGKLKSPNAPTVKR